MSCNFPVVISTGKGNGGKSARLLPSHCALKGNQRNNRVHQWNMIIYDHIISNLKKQNIGEPWNLVKHICKKRQPKQPPWLVDKQARLQLLLDNHLLFLATGQLLFFFRASRYLQSNGLQKCFSKQHVRILNPWDWKVSSYSSFQHKVVTQQNHSNSHNTSPLEIPFFINI